MENTESKDTYKVLHLINKNPEAKTLGEHFTPITRIEEFDEKPTLKQMQSWTDSGMIEVITVKHEGEHRHAIIDEEGKYNNTNTPNSIATRKWWQYLKDAKYSWGNDVIVGNCAVLLNFELE